jgi:malate/lactate dehydrogenase
VQDVCLSLPCVVSDYGIRERLEPELNVDEQRRFVESAAEVRDTVRIGSPSDGNWTEDRRDVLNRS